LVVLVAMTNLLRGRSHAWSKASAEGWGWQDGYPCFGRTRMRGGRGGHIAAWPSSCSRPSSCSAPSSRPASRCTARRASLAHGEHARRCALLSPGQQCTRPTSGPRVLRGRARSRRRDLGEDFAGRRAPSMPEVGGAARRARGRASTGWASTACTSTGLLVLAGLVLVGRREEQSSPVTAREAALL